MPSLEGAAGHEGVGHGSRSGVAATAYSLNRKTRHPGRRPSRRLVAIRVFASLCALGMVSAFAIAALLPPEMDLGAILLVMDPKSLGGLHRFVLRHAGTGAWDLLLPFLLRPGWMLPLMAGVIAGGVAFSLNYLDPSRQSTRRSG